MIQMLLYFRAQAIEKHHENFLLAWVSDQAEPLDKICNLLFYIIGLLPNGMEMTMMLDVCAVQRVFSVHSSLNCSQVFTSCKVVRN